MSEQSDQIKADVEGLQSAATNAANHIVALTDHALNLSDATITDEQFDNLHTALVDMTNMLNEAVSSSQDALGPMAQPTEPTEPKGPQR